MTVVDQCLIEFIDQPGDTAMARCMAKVRKHKYFLIFECKYLNFDKYFLIFESKC